MITAERGEGALTRHGIEEYVSDCVILLDNQVKNRITTRQLRVIKYRGSSHGANEYPFLIDDQGVSVLPVTSLGLQHKATSERISSGIARLDSMLGGKGYYRASSILVSGTAGTGKSSVAAHFVDAACRRGERCLYLATEESPEQVSRNTRSIGIDLGRWMKKGLLHFDATRPTFHGLEMHLLRIHKVVNEFTPRAVVVDPFSNFLTLGDDLEVKSMLTRLIDFFKSRQITALFTSLTHGGEALEQTEVGVSSLMDVWLLLRDIESGGERTRGLYVLKARGMAHSNQIREFLINDRGIELLDVYLGPEGVLTGAARAAQEAKEKAERLLREQDIQRKRRDLERKRQALEAQIAFMRAQFEAEAEELKKKIEQQTRAEDVLEEDRSEMARLRKAHVSPDEDEVRNGKKRKNGGAKAEYEASR